MRYLAPYIFKLFAIFTAYFYDIKTLIHTLLVMIAVDFISGVLSSIKAGQKFRSNKMKRTIHKTMWYIVAVMAAYIMETTFRLQWTHMTNIIAGLICATEFVSVLENIAKITGQPLFIQIANVLRTKINNYIKNKTDEQVK